MQSENELFLAIATSRKVTKLTSELLKIARIPFGENAEIVTFVARPLSVRVE